MIVDANLLMGIQIGAGGGVIVGCIIGFIAGWLLKGKN